MRISILLVASLALMAPPTGHSATYYIDFASGADSKSGTSKLAPWKRAPGMNGFAGTYTHRAGDHLVFKGGVTWDETIAKWVISESGEAGALDYYGVDKTWFEGSSWTPPVFDGGSRKPVVSSPFIYVTGSYLIFDGLRVQNIGVPGINQGNRAIEFDNGHDLTVQNMILPVQSRIALLYQAFNGVTVNNLTFVGNDISNCSWGIGIAVARPHTVIDNIVIHDNVFHDFHSQIASGAHADGVFIYGQASDSTQYSQNIQFFNNSMYGDWSKSDDSKAGVTAFFNCQAARSILIYNNHGTVSAASGGYVFEFWRIPGWPDTSIRVYNNSFRASPDWYGFIYATAEASVTAKNNLYAGGTTVYYCGSEAASKGLVSDSNLFHGWAKPNVFANLKGKAGVVGYSQFKALGYEASGRDADPQFDSPTDLHPRSSSPAIGVGVNLSETFAIDAEGNRRPSTGPWNLGAYQRVKPQ